MSRKPEYIQLEANDDVAAIRDRLSFIRGKRVLLVWPEEGTALTRELDLVLVQREARRRVIQLALVTHDADVIRHAQKLGISVFETIRASERGKWQRGRGRVFTQRFHKPKDEPAPDELMEVASRVKGRRNRISRIRFVLERIVIVGVFFAVIVAVSYIALPNATISLQITQNTLLVETNITASPAVQEVDIENQIIPATTLRATVETTGTIPSTGTRDIADAPASGVVVFTNQTDQTIEIAASSTISTSAGTPILYKTLTNASIPAGVGERSEVEIEAMQSSYGQIGNVEVGMINAIVGPLEDVVTVRNLSPTSGGESRELTAVSENDLTRLLSIVRGQLQSIAYEQMQLNLTDTQFIIIESIKIVEERNDWTTFSHEPGDLSDTVTLTMTAVIEALVIDDRLGRQITFAQMSSQIAPGRIIEPSSITYIRGPVMEVDDNQVVFSASGTGLVRAQVDLIYLQERLAGQDIETATQILLAEADIAEATLPIIQVSPNWFSRLPLIPNRIEFEIAG